MQEFPHHYTVQAIAGSEGDVLLESEHLPSLETAPPAEFGGPGDHWSPESLLVASVADCFILSFRAIARASKLPWTSLTCEVERVLDRVENLTQFTQFFVSASLVIPEANEEKAERILHKSEKNCLITNSLKGEVHLEIKIEIDS